MLGLEQSLNAHSNYGNVDSRACKTNDRKNSFVIDTILAVTLEHLYLNNGSVPQTNRLPTSLNIQQKRYNLIKLVAFEELGNKVLPLHYFAYIKKQGMWEKRDDMQENVETVVELPSNTKISLLIYVLNTD